MFKTAFSKIIVVSDDAVCESREIPPCCGAIPNSHACFRSLRRTAHEKANDEQNGEKGQHLCRTMRERSKPTPLAPRDRFQYRTTRERSKLILSLFDFLLLNTAPRAKGANPKTAKTQRSGVGCFGERKQSRNALRACFTSVLPTHSLFRSPLLIKNLSGSLSS